MGAICRETEKGNDFVLKQTEYGGQIITSFTQPNSQILKNVLDPKARLFIPAILGKNWLKIQNLKITTYLYENTNFLSFNTLNFSADLRIHCVTDYYAHLLFRCKPG